MKENSSKKAWAVDLSRIEEGYMYADEIVYADKRSEARKKLLALYYGASLRGSTDELTYLTIPVVRQKNLDLIEYKGEFYTQGEIERIERTRERNEKLEAILADTSVEFCYIRKGGYYYRPMNSGYTEYIRDAGVYTKADAVQSARRCGELTPIPITVEEHNKLINEEIQKLKEKLL